MKRCPTCQRTYPDNAPDQCPYDGTAVMTDTPQPQYYPGAQQQPYQAQPPGAPPQWPQQGGYQQPGQPPPGYGVPYAPVAGGSRGLSNAAFFSGLAAFIILVLDVVFYVLVTNGAMDLGTAIPIAQVLQVLTYVMLFAGLASIVLGIIALVTAGRNPAISKAKAIIGIVLGVIPLIFFFIGMANRGGM